MQIKIVKEYSLYLNRIKYRVWVGDLLVESFDREDTAMHFIQCNRENWRKALDPETIYTEEI